MESQNFSPEEIKFAIVGAQILDGVSAQTIASGTVLIGKDGRIITVGPSQQVKPPEGAPILNTPGMTLLPGLIDAHVHIAWDKTLYSISTAQDYRAFLGKRSHEHQLVRAGHHAQLALAAGVTTVRDCGAESFAVLALRDAINAGEFVGPRILVSGRPITTTAGHLYSGWAADNAHEVRKAVRYLASQGVDLVKLVASGGNTTPGSNVTRAQYTLEEMRVAVEEAHRLGLQVAAHAISADSIRLAAEAGVDTIEHCSWISADGKNAEPDEAAVDAMVKNGVRVDHAVIPQPYQFPEETGYAPSSKNEWLLNLLRVRWPFLRHMRERGVRVIVGTDACVGYWPGTAFWPGYQDLARAVEIIVRDAGFTPMEGIRMVTSEAAQALRLPEVGTIEPGKRADLILIARDLLKDIRALREVEMVFCDGRLVARHGQIVMDPTQLDMGSHS